jgi:hypothetical protein
MAFNESLTVKRFAHHHGLKMVAAAGGVTDFNVSARQAQLD